MLKKLDSKDIWVRIFEISESQKHKKGFTVYKVISTVFPRNFPDGATKITVWKRYKEFKQLHKDLEQIFKQLYLKGTFPKLPKDKIFGRFDETVIEERRESAVELLEFAASYPLLFTNKVFVNFFENGFNPSDFVGSELNKPCATLNEGNVLIEEERKTDRNQACLIPDRIWESTDSIPGEAEHESSSSPSYSCSSPCNIQTPTHSLNHSNILEVDVSNSANNSSKPQGPNVITFTDSSQCPDVLLPHTNTSVPGPSLHSLDQIAPTSKPTVTVPAVLPSASFAEDLNFAAGDQDCFGSLPSSQSLENLSLGAGDGASANKVLSRNGSVRTNARFNLFDFLPVFTKPNETPTTAADELSESLMSTYVCEAAGHFSVAQHHESNSEYDLAFHAYTEGIRVLLEGAQNDTDSQRRSLVKKKVTKYLSQAESLKVKLEKSSTIDGNMISLEQSASRSDDGFVMIENNVMPSSVEELQSFKMVGYTSKILVAVDISSHGGPDCFAIKVLRKSLNPLDAEKPSLIPSTIPFMVQLIKWFNTDDSIILILQYAGGGKLVNFVHAYQTRALQVWPQSCDNDVTMTILSETNENSIENNIPPTASTSHNLNQPDTLAELASKTIKQIKENKIEVSSLENDAENNVTDLKHLEDFSSDSNSGMPEPEVENGQNNQNDAQYQQTTEQTENNSESNFNELIQNSRLLLQNVSKTLLQQQQKEFPLSVNENRKKSIPKTLSEQEDVLSRFLQNFPGCNESQPFATLKDSSPDYDVTEMRSDDSVVQMIPECCVKIWAAELVIALDKLHGQGITYGDLDIKNILLGENGHVLLSYKALWNEVDTKPTWNEYSAPEIRSNFGRSLWKIHPSADWWSLGAILFLLLTGQKLQDFHPEGIHPQTVICIPNTNICGDPLSTVSKTLLLELLQFSSTLRLGYYGAAEIKSHPFFHGFNWEDAEKTVRPSV